MPEGEDGSLPSLLYLVLLLRSGEEDGIFPSLLSIVLSGL